MVQSGLVWSDWLWSGLAGWLWPGLAGSDLVWLWSGLVWLPGWLAVVWSGLVSSGQRIIKDIVVPTFWCWV